jgi:hypothetical protein
MGRRSLQIVTAILAAVPVVTGLIAIRSIQHPVLSKMFC